MSSSGNAPSGPRLPKFYWRCIKDPREWILQEDRESVTRYDEKNGWQKIYGKKINAISYLLPFIFLPDGFYYAASADKSSCMLNPDRTRRRASNT